jgi:hypothetical protein
MKKFECKLSLAITQFVFRKYEWGGGGGGFITFSQPHHWLRMIRVKNNPRNPKTPRNGLRGKCFFKVVFLLTPKMLKPKTLK